jgi:hypothetical protein
MNNRTRSYPFAGFKVRMGEVAGKKAGFLDSRTQKYE